MAPNKITGREILGIISPGQQGGRDEKKQSRPQIAGIITLSNNKIRGGQVNPQKLIALHTGTRRS